MGIQDITVVKHRPGSIVPIDLGVCARVHAQVVSPVVRRPLGLVAAS